MLGKLISDKTVERDAVHVAIYPAEAGMMLSPMQPVTVIDGVALAAKDRGVGIVDPFLNETVFRGQCFWVCLYPDTVTGIVHHWKHAAFDDGNLREFDELPKIKAQKYLEHVAMCVDLNVGHLKTVLSNYIKYDRVEIFGYDIDYDFNTKEMWDAYFVITGNKITDSDTLPFRCAC